MPAFGRTLDHQIHRRNFRGGGGTRVRVPPLFKVEDTVPPLLEAAFQNSSLQTRPHMTFTSENYWGVNLLTYLLTYLLTWTLTLVLSSTDTLSDPVPPFWLWATLNFERQSTAPGRVSKDVEKKNAMNSPAGLRRRPLSYDRTYSFWQI